MNSVEAVVENILGWEKCEGKPSVRGYWWAPNDLHDSTLKIGWGHGARNPELNTMVTTPKFDNWEATGLLLESLESMGMSPRLDSTLDSKWVAIAVHICRSSVNKSPHRAVYGLSLEVLKDLYHNG